VTDLAGEPRSAEAGGVKTYPMSYEQEAAWLDDRLTNGPSRFLESWVTRLSGAVNLDAAQWAIASIVDRHEVLRTRLTAQRGRPVQLVMPEHDTRLLRRPCQATALDEELRRTVAQPLDLDVSPLRATALRLAPHESVLVVQLHHAVVDDWALAILEEEFGQLYAAYVQRRQRQPSDLAPLPIQYGQYAAAQQLAGIDPADADFWQVKLSGLTTLNPVPPDQTPPARPSRRGGQAHFRLGGDVTLRLRQFCRARRVTPFTVFAATLAGLLSGYRGYSESVLAVPVSRRGSADLDRLIGVVSDVLPLRQQVQPDKSFTDLVNGTRQAVLEAMAHRNIPYAKLAARIGKRVQGRVTPLAPVALIVDDTPRVPLDLPGVTAQRIYVHSGMVKFDLALTLVSEGAGYRGFLDYATDLYTARTAHLVTSDFCAMLSAVLADPDSSLSAIRRPVIRPSDVDPASAARRLPGDCCHD
jgi:Condensation domain